MRTHCLALALALALAESALAAEGALTLSPAAVSLRGGFGQSTTQALTLANSTGIALSFVLDAKDVIVRDGRREFVDAGELAGSIAASAVFSERAVTIPPGESRRVTVTLTLPPATGHRAVVALFRGTTRVGDAVPSIGALLTFTLSEDFVLATSGLALTPQGASSNLVLEARLANQGSEPLAPQGVAAILDTSGALVGRAPFERRRLLPGERLTMRAEYPGELAPGAYRALATFEYEGRAVTTEAWFTVR
jgi:hypothetical protein